MSRKSAIEKLIKEAIESFDDMTVRELRGVGISSFPYLLAERVFEHPKIFDFLTASFRVCAGREGRIIESTLHHAVESYILHMIMDDETEEYLKLFEEKWKNL